MTNEWMLDVLTDLRAFSVENGLDVTGKQLDHVMAVAAAEIASMQGIAQNQAQQGIGDAGEFYRPFAEGRNS
jgi:predicted transcriptional regulator